MLILPNRMIGNHAAAIGTPTSALEFGATELWYSARRSTNTAAGSGIGTQTNISGIAGRDITQTDDTRRPTLSTINGNVSLLYDGVNDDLSNTNFTTSFSAVALTFAAVLTVTAVDTTNRDVFRARSADANNRVSLRRTLNDSNVFYDSAAGTDLNIGVDDVFVNNATRYVIGRLRQSAASNVLWSTGATGTGTGPADPSTAIDQIFVGGQEAAVNLAAHIHDIVVWSRFFTDTERTLLELYLRQEWIIS